MTSFLQYHKITRGLYSRHILHCFLQHMVGNQSLGCRDCMADYGWIWIWIWNSPEPKGNQRDAQRCVWRIPTHQKWVGVCCPGSRQIYYCEGEHFLFEDPLPSRRFSYLRPSPGCARFPEILQNFSELEILWSWCLVVFLALTLKLPIQTSLPVPKIPVCVRSGEKCAKRVHPQCTRAWLTTNAGNNVLFYVMSEHIGVTCQTTMESGK